MISLKRIIKKIKNHFDPTYRHKLIGELVFDISDPWPDDDMMPPPLDAQKAVDVLFHYFRGPDAYITSPVGARQFNSEAVYEIMINNRGDKKFMKYLEEKYGTIPKCKE